MVTVREISRRETQAKVLETADALFQQQGFSATTIRDIAAAAGVSVGTVMVVGDKSALLVTVFDRLIESLHQEPRARGASGDSQADRVMTLLAPFIELFTSRPELARIYASILVAGSHSSAIFTDLATLLIEEIHEVVGEHASDDRELARAIYLAYLGSLFTWAAGGSNDPAALGSKLHSTMTAICQNQQKTP